MDLKMFVLCEGSQAKRMHKVNSHLYKILGNANMSIVTECGMCLAWGPRKKLQGVIMKVGKT